MISAKSISKTFDNKKVLDNVSVEIGEGEVISIVGPSGAGKTTLLHILSTLDSADDNESFELILNKIKVQDLNEKEISNFRNTQIGFIFQFHELLPEFTALENVIIPAIIKGEKKDVSLKKAKTLLETLDLSNIINQFHSQL